MTFSVRGGLMFIQLLIAMQAVSLTASATILHVPEQSKLPYGPDGSIYATPDILPASHWQMHPTSSLAPLADTWPYIPTASSSAAAWPLGIAAATTTGPKKYCKNRRLALPNTTLAMPPLDPTAPVLPSGLIPNDDARQLSRALPLLSRINELASQLPGADTASTTASAVDPYPWSIPTLSVTSAPKGTGNYTSPDSAAADSQQINPELTLSPLPGSSKTKSKPTKSGTKKKSASPSDSSKAANNDAPTSTMTVPTTTVTIPKSTDGQTAASSANSSAASSSSSATSSTAPSSSSDAASASNGQGPTKQQFDAAVQAYSKTSGGGAPPAPSQALYDDYIKYVASKLSMDEQAMFLANCLWETGGLQHTEEIACKDGSCSYGQFYGRGMLQITWNDNYTKASQSIYGNDTLVQNPNLASQTPDSWRTAVWYWDNMVHPVITPQVLSSRDLGASVKAINGAIECPANDKAQNRLTIYNAILEAWNMGTGPAGNLAGC